MRKPIRLVGAILIGASLTTICPLNPMTSTAQIVSRVNIKIQGGLENMIKSGDYPKYKSSYYVSVSVYYDKPIRGG